MGIHVILKVLM